MNTAFKPMYEWKDIPWRKLERDVFKLQKRIYRASKRGDVKNVRRLQKLLMKSWSGKTLAVRRVTQDNQGKKTAGVDGVKSLNPSQRLDLVSKLALSCNAKPTRRVWIPKPGKEEKRPLGIPTISDRAIQALAKIAIEPEWEAKFEPNSYGFRPGRSCHDAIAAIFQAIHLKPKFVLDADISKCFDKINHKALLNKINTFPLLRRQIRAWLKAGVLDQGEFFNTEEGTPQGGVISPLLANIALHGLENTLKDYVESLIIRRIGGKSKGRYYSNSQKRQSLSVIRYADDFVILHDDPEIIGKCEEITRAWLKDMGLELKPSKTRKAHTIEKSGDEAPGFKFLGFTIRQFQVGKNTSKQGFKTIIKPSKDSIKRQESKLIEIIQAHKGAPQAALIARLNPVIKGWARYYSTVCSKHTYKRIDNHVTIKLLSWANHRHPQKNNSWVANRYWLVDKGGGWAFVANTKNVPLRLLTHRTTPIVRHVKVKEDKTPYDGDWIYWSSRLGRHPDLPRSKAVLLKRQKGKCAWCGQFFQDGDLMETDHIEPSAKGGKNTPANKQLLHRHCHDEKSSYDGSRGAS